MKTIRKGRELCKKNLGMMFGLELANLFTAFDSHDSYDSDQTDSITFNHYPSWGFNKISIKLQLVNCLYVSSFQQISPHFHRLFPRVSPFRVSPVLPFSLRSPGAMDEAQAVLKASDDEAKRICQEIRRIGGTDRAMDLGHFFWGQKMDEIFPWDLRDLRNYPEDTWKLMGNKTHGGFLLFICGVCLRDYLEIHGKNWGFLGFVGFV